MFPQENQPGNLVNVLQLSCPGGRQTLLLGGQIQFVYTQAARDTDRQPHTGRRPCRRLPQGAQRPQEKVPSAGQPSPGRDSRARPAKRAFTMGETTLFGGDRASCSLEARRSRKSTVSIQFSRRLPRKLGHLALPPPSSMCQSKPSAILRASVVLSIDGYYHTCPPSFGREGEAPTGLFKRFK